MATIPGRSASRVFRQSSPLPKPQSPADSPSGVQHGPAGLASSPTPDPWLPEPGRRVLPEAITSVFLADVELAAGRCDTAHCPNNRPMTGVCFKPEACGGLRANDPQPKRKLDGPGSRPRVGWGADVRPAHWVG